MFLIRTSHVALLNHSCNFVVILHYDEMRGIYIMGGRAEKC